MKKQKIFLIIFLTVLLWVPVFAQARGLVPCGGYNADGSREKACTVVDLFYLVARVVNWLIMIAGGYAVYRIIYGSAGLIMSQGNQEALTKHKGTISNAIIGFVLVLSSFMLVNTLVNGLLSSKCPIDLRSPLTYLTVKDPSVNDCVSSKK